MGNIYIYIYYIYIYSKKLQLAAYGQFSMFFLKTFYFQDMLANFHSIVTTCKRPQFFGNKYWAVF